MEATGASLRFDLSRITAREMHVFFEAVRAQNVEVMAATFARIVTACPWGDPASPETYLALPFYGEFQEVVAALGEAARNFQRPSRSAST